MSFVRPEAQAALWRWREVLVGIVLGAFGFSLTARPGLLFYIGLAMIALAAVLIVLGIPRARFRGVGGGPGLVQVVEGQISYFGPLTGGVCDTSTISAVLLDASGHPAHWELQHPGGPPVHIPVTAEGADALFEALQSLPGLSPTKLGAARQARDGRIAVWRRAGSLAD